METNNNQVSGPASQAGALDYAAALRQYNKYGRGRSMKKFCEELGHNPRKPKSVYVFSGRNPRVKKVLIREYNRYELTTIRLDDGRFIRPQTDPERAGGKICWSDFVMLTECAASTSTVIKYID